jgi:hypothetical protein
MRKMGIDWARFRDDASTRAHATTDDSRWKP